MFFQLAERPRYMPVSLRPSGASGLLEVIGVTVISSVHGLRHSPLPDQSLRQAPFVERTLRVNTVPFLIFCSSNCVTESEVPVARLTSSLPFALMESS